MTLEPYLTVSGNGIVADRYDDDAPLLIIEFCNEAFKLSGSAKLNILASAMNQMVKQLREAGVIK